jgi:hypothetical protein
VDQKCVWTYNFLAYRQSNLSLGSARTWAGNFLALKMSCRNVGRCVWYIHTYIHTYQCTFHGSTTLFVRMKTGLGINQAITKLNVPWNNLHLLNQKCHYHVHISVVLVTLTSHLNPYFHLHKHLPNAYYLRVSKPKCNMHLAFPNVFYSFRPSHPP